MTSLGVGTYFLLPLFARNRPAKQPIGKYTIPERDVDSIASYLSLEEGNKMSRIFLSSVLLLVPAVWAAAAELFLPLTEEQEEAVRRDNPYYLQKQLYFAKRHRIVRVNAGLLLSPELPAELTFNFFQDYSPTFSVTVREIGPEQVRFRVDAVHVDPGYKPEDWTSSNPEMSRASARELIRDIYTVVINGTKHVHDEARDRSWIVQNLNRAVFDGQGGVSNAKKLDASDAVYFAVGTKFHDPVLGTKYNVEPLVSDPRYSLVWETDFAKTYLKSDHGEDVGEPRGGQNQSRKSDHDAFLQALGDDPRAATWERDRIAFRDTLKDKLSATDSKDEEDE